MFMTSLDLGVLQQLQWVLGFVAGLGGDSSSHSHLSWELPGL